VLADHVGEDFGVGLGLEFMTVAQEFVPKRGVVLNDSVVNNGQVPGSIDMGMSIGVTR